MNPFINSNTNKRYYTLDYFYRQKFNSKVFKVSLNLGLTCPNKDGKKGFGGCIYCKNSSGDFAGNKCDPLKKQFESIKNILLKKWPKAKYIAYFQAGTNTYGDLSFLKKSFEEVLTFDDVIGINIATRCDSITDECLDYLEELNKKCYLTIELGLQTIHEKTMKFLNLGYTKEEFLQTYKKLKERNINVVVHIINSLPYETEDMMIETIKFLNNLNVTGIKIHMLCILKNTKLEQLYQQEKFHILTKEEYINVVCKQLGYLNKDIVINRITADPTKDDLIEPSWLLKKFCVLNDIDKKLSKDNLYQGCFLENKEKKS